MLRRTKYLHTSTTTATKRHPKDEEHRLQCACVRWFKMQYKQLSYALFAVPNGGRRDPITGARLKAEGALAGVSDLILLQRNSRYGALLIEMKTSKGRHSPAQKAWSKAITSGDEFKYVTCRSLQEFMFAINEYLKG
jgi:hypothetical protein